MGSVREAIVERFKGKGGTELNGEVRCYGRDIRIGVRIFNELLKVNGRRDSDCRLVQQ